MTLSPDLASCMANLCARWLCVEIRFESDPAARSEERPRDRPKPEHRSAKVALTLAIAKSVCASPRTREVPVKLMELANEMID
jgi:hypothetical protein